MHDLQTQLKTIKKGVAEIISEPELVKKLELSIREKRPLRIKAGFDPSANTPLLTAPIRVMGSEAAPSSNVPTIA